MCDLTGNVRALLPWGHYDSLSSLAGFLVTLHKGSCSAVSPNSTCLAAFFTVRCENEAELSTFYTNGMYLGCWQWHTKPASDQTKYAFEVHVQSGHMMTRTPLFANWLHASINPLSELVPRQCLPASISRMWKAVCWLKSRWGGECIIGHVNNVPLE